MDYKPHSLILKQARLESDRKMVEFDISIALLRQELVATHGEEYVFNIELDLIDESEGFRDRKLRI